jgi:iron complex transport system substrate-binding protein
VAEDNQVENEKTVRAECIKLPLRYVRSVRIEETAILDSPGKTLIIELAEAMCVTSTLAGERKGVTAVGNHYLPLECWSASHRLELGELRELVLKGIGKAENDCCLLFTGVDMENLSIRKAEYKDITVFALVTAAVESNAMRMPVDDGLFYEPGTINTIILTNMRLSPGARARAVITATEAKTAALQDLDVRSSFSPCMSQATGTGTDEVLVVEGNGTRLDGAGGHCKLGELIARAVYEGVKDAVFRQDGLSGRRGVMRRLEERHIDIGKILQGATWLKDGPIGSTRLAHLLEQLMLQPRYASFVESAFALSDANERGLLSNLDSFETWCKGMAEEIAGSKLNGWTGIIESREVPVVVRMSLNALLNGLVQGVAGGASTSIVSGTGDSYR